VWNIEVKGNLKVSVHEIIECLQENDVDVGLKKVQIDCSALETLLREQFHELGWVSVYFERTSLCIEVKESLYDTIEHIDTDSNRMYHLVANKDAVIHSIVTRAGTAVVKKGETVKKGEILVLGQSEIFDDNGEIKDTLQLKADAQIYGDVIYELKIPLSEIEIMGMKIAGKYDDRMLYHLGYRKLNDYLDMLEKNDVCILRTDIFIEKEEKNICFLVKIYAREQIGINIPVEEVLENEFE
jgi:similar to stage IV sporulation protein